MSNTNDPPDTVWLYHPPPFEPIESNSWIEVTHCMNKTVSKFEDKGYWCYKAVGSGIFINVGNTKAFDTHLDAVKYFLEKEKCHDVNGEGECEGDFYKLVDRAIALNSDSLQFVKHSDMRCGNTAVEILYLHGSGRNVFEKHIDFRMGWGSCISPQGRCYIIVS